MTTVNTFQDSLAVVATSESVEERTKAIHNGLGVSPPSASLYTVPPMDTTCLSDVEPKRVEWLWRGRIPRGKLVTFDGDPGAGKSTILADIAARVSTGESMPDGSPGIKGAVVILTAEDDADDTIRPRLEAAGADLSNIFFVNINEDLPNIVDGADELISTLMYRRAVLFIVDPFVTFLGAKTRTKETTSTSAAMFKIKRACARTNCSGVLVRHLRKETRAGKAVYSGTDSISIIGTARGGLIVGRDPENADLYVMAVSKANLAAKEDTKSIQYRIVTKQGPVGPIGGVEWLDEVDYHADEIAAGHNPNRATAREAAEDWLREHLKTGPILQTDLRNDAKEAGHAYSTLKRAKKLVGVVSAKGFDGKWRWSLEKIT